MPVFNEVAHIPLFMFLPEHAELGGERRQGLTQTTDLMPTLLDIFGVTPPAETRGKSLLPLVAKDVPCHDAILYGQHGAAINITDGRYTYFRYPPDIFDGNLNQYTLMPTHIISMFSVDELKNATLAPPFDFTQGTPVMKITVIPSSPFFKRHGPGALIDCSSRLFDLKNDPNQTTPIDNPEVEERLIRTMARIMMDNDAPEELYKRFDLLDYLPQKP